MAGNVFEWTRTDYGTKKDLDDFEFVLDFEKRKHKPSRRGGSWYINRVLARCASRDRDHPYFRFYDIGFRCVRTLK
jgi:formylglycine-generating enzyme required for sulfatase activity